MGNDFPVVLYNTLAQAEMAVVTLQLLFWSSLLLIAYAYVGYALLLAVLARLRPQPVRRAAILPTVSVVMAVHNEETTLPRKLASVAALNYPRHLLEIIVVSDGSSDRTNEILAASAPQVTSLRLPASQGKGIALNHAVEAATGEIAVFMDARQTVDANALTELVSCFADAQVGAVSGELHLEAADGTPSPDALGIYWKIEKTVRKLESATGSVVGVTGALFAMRRALYRPLPPGTLLDDVLTPMQIARAGYRVLFLDSAIARDRIFVAPGKEFARKVRTLTGNYQLLQLAPWLLGLANPLLFRLVSHKFLRLLVPLLLVLLFCTSALLPMAIYRAALALQLLTYLLALFGLALPKTRSLRAVGIPYTFAMLNVAATLAFYNFLTGRARWA